MEAITAATGTSLHDPVYGNTEDENTDYGGGGTGGGGDGVKPVTEESIYYTLPFAIALLVLWALTVVLTVSVISVLVYRRFCRSTRRFQILGKTNISTISMDSDVLLSRSTENVSTVF